MYIHLVSKMQLILETHNISGIGCCTVLIFFCLQLTGIILWELVALKKPYDGMNREEFYYRVVHGGERPVVNKKWPEDLTELMKSCWE